MQNAWSGERRLGLGNRLASRFLNQVDGQDYVYFLDILAAALHKAIGTRVAARLN